MLTRSGFFSGRSKNFLDLCRGYGYKGVIAGTRKTTPGERTSFRGAAGLILIPLCDRVPARREVRHVGRGH